MRLFSYKMTNDSGFAPNPFWGRLTLATCKPEIRKAKRVGDWIAGFTSRELCRDPIGSERLV
jgi:Nucleotide modification associated domain 2